MAHHEHSGKILKSDSECQHLSDKAGICSPASTETGVTRSLFEPQDWPAWQAPPEPTGVGATPASDDAMPAQACADALWLTNPIGAFGCWISSEQVNQGKGYSSDSIKVYAAMWSKFTRFCIDHGASAALANEGALMAFMQALAEQRQLIGKLKPHSPVPQAVRAQDSGGIGRQARRYLSLISRVQAHLISLQLRSTNPALHLLNTYAPEPQRPDPSALPPSADHRLCTLSDQAEQRQSAGWRDARDHAIIELIIGCGITSRQIRSLCDDPLQIGLNDDPPWVYPVAARRGQVRPGRIPLAADAARSLQQWLAVRRLRIPGPFVFPSNLAGEMMSAASVYRAVSETMRLAQEDKNAPVVDHLGPRTLRHTFATRQLRAGRPLSVLQQWMGHRNATATAVYRRLVPDPNGVEPA